MRKVHGNTKKGAARAALILAAACLALCCAAAAFAEQPAAEPPASAWLVDDSQETEEPTATPQATEAPTATPQATEAPTATPGATEQATVTPQESEQPAETPQATEQPTETPQPSEQPAETPQVTEQPTEAPPVARTPAEWLAGYDLPVYRPVTLANPSPEPIPLGQETPYYPHVNGFLPDHAGYVDGTISVRVESREIQHTKVQFTWIQIADASQLRTELASPYPRTKEVVATQMAKQAHSVVAMSGDWFTARKNHEGVVYRNGQLLRSKNCFAYDGLVIDNKGDFHILIQGTEEDFAAYQGRIMHSFVFGPALVLDGELVPHDTFGETPSFWLMKQVGGLKRTQRSVLCQMDTLSYLIITTEGPEQSKDGGMTIPEVADIAYAIGAKQAFNMDGGSSAWLVLGEERINTLQTKNLRKISDIVCFVTAEPDPDAQATEAPATDVPPAEAPAADAPATETPAGEELSVQY